MTLPRNVALALAALCASAALVATESATAISSCRLTVEFRNPYLSQVQVDLRQSKVQVGLVTDFTSWGPKRRLGTGKLRVKSGSTRRKAFRLPLGGCDAARRYTWEMTYRGDRYVLEPLFDGVSGSDLTVAFAQFADMPPRPRVRTPVLSRQIGVIGRPTFSWAPTGRARNGTFTWKVTQRLGGSTFVVADGTTTRKRVRIPALDDGLYEFRVYQSDGAGYRSSTATESFRVGAPERQAR